MQRGLTMEGFHIRQRTRLSARKHHGHPWLTPAVAAPLSGQTTPVKQKIDTSLNLYM
jgi:hypothetical protein